MPRRIRPYAGGPVYQGIEASPTPTPHFKTKHCHPAAFRSRHHCLVTGGVSGYIKKPRNHDATEATTTARSQGADTPHVSVTRQILNCHRGKDTELMESSVSATHSIVNTGTVLAEEGRHTRSDRVLLA